MFWCEGASGGPFGCKARARRHLAGTRRTFQPEQSINTHNNTVALVAADVTGNAYALWSSGRTVLTSATGAFGAVDTTFTVNPVVSNSFSVAPLRTGGAFVAFTRTGSGSASVYTTRYDPAGASWSTPDLREGGAFNSPLIATNASGQAVAAWLGPASGGGMNAVSIATFDGSTWNAVTHSTIGTGSTGGGPSTFSLGAYANGDALIVYRDNTAGVAPAIMAQRSSARIKRSSRRGKPWRRRQNNLP